MIGPIVRIQKEIIRLLNDSEGMEHGSMELQRIAQFVNKMSPFEVTHEEANASWRLVNKKTRQTVQL